VRELLPYMRENSAVVFAAFELILVAKNLERIGDHATNIAEDVIYFVAGRHVRHPALARRERRDSARATAEIPIGKPEKRSLPRALRVPHPRSSDSGREMRRSRHSRRPRGISRRSPARIASAPALPRSLKPRARSGT